MVRSQGVRSGYTKITSVSVTKEMLKIIDQHNLSPTEIFRRGLGVTYHDLGLEPYVNSSMNKDRSQYVKKFLESLEKAEDLDEFNESLKSISNFSTKVQMVSQSVNEINVILKKMGVSV